MQTTRMKSLFIISFLLVTSILIAQEIPSRVNDGVSLSQQKEVKRDALAGLNLSREQLKELQALNKDAKQQQKNLTSDSNINAKQRREKLQILKKQQADKRKAVLTAEQYTKYEQNLKEIKEQGKNVSRQKV
ncbi:hypothetical protein [Niabella ginsengisoli]|uniref:DUF4890 domain-containing protein n=1 Tax=Niabella ginsengisoli TaxID=522298 RepID=A0ABS9SEI7_9BACT|nr:hypothetical protein [Niabella ginsengisoli]MCH5596771.1 hypothetical protein [Niabella ginsengisoli]